MPAVDLASFPILRGRLLKTMIVLKADSRQLVSNP